MYFIKKKAIYCCGNIFEKKLDNNYNLWRSHRYPLNWGPIDKKSPAYIYTNNCLQFKDAWNKVGGYNEDFESAGGEDIEYSKKINKYFPNQSYYFAIPKSYHIANDNLITLSNRVWRYHSFGYKIKTPGFKRFLKLTIKQLRFFFVRSFEDLLKLRINFIKINLFILIYFIKYEINLILSKKG